MWIAIFGCAALMVGSLGWLSRRSKGSFVLINLASACLAVALFEAYLVLVNTPTEDSIRLEGTINENFTRPDDTLGYVPNENTKVTARKLYKNTVLYDVVY